RHRPGPGHRPRDRPGTRRLRHLREPPRRGDGVPPQSAGLGVCRNAQTVTPGPRAVARGPGGFSHWRRLVSADGERPPPEHFLSLIREQQRGRLKVYLGFAAGVGKTYEMLQEAHRLKQQGVDVVIGVIETHGRAETAAMVGDLERVPRRRIEYRGVALEEMDLDALLARHPTVALVDELAHTNAPGSRHAKRYQDVEDLLRAGINVIS